MGHRAGHAATLLLLMSVLAACPAPSGSTPEGRPSTTTDPAATPSVSAPPTAEPQMPATSTAAAPEATMTSDARDDLHPPAFHDGTTTWWVHRPEDWSEPEGLARGSVDDPDVLYRTRPDWGIQAVAPLPDGNAVIAELALQDTQYRVLHLTTDGSVKVIASDADAPDIALAPRPVPARAGAAWTSTDQDDRSCVEWFSPGEGRQQLHCSEPGEVYLHLRASDDELTWRRSADDTQDACRDLQSLNLDTREVRVVVEGCEVFDGVVADGHVLWTQTPLPPPSGDYHRVAVYARALGDSRALSLPDGRAGSTNSCQGRLLYGEFTSDERGMAMEQVRAWVPAATDAAVIFSSPSPWVPVSTTHCLDGWVTVTAVNTAAEVVTRIHAIDLRT